MWSEETSKNVDASWLVDFDIRIQQPRILQQTRVELLHEQEQKYTTKMISNFTFLYSLTKPSQKWGFFFVPATLNLDEGMASEISFVIVGMILFLRP